MLISFKNNFIFIANLKTGSTAIENSLKKHAGIRLCAIGEGKHMSYADALQILNLLPNKVSKVNYYTFAVMRDPLSYLISIYNSHRKPDLDGKNHSTKDISFSEFIQKWCIDEKSWQVEPQRNRFLDSKGAVALDYICVYERLDEELAKVYETIGVSETLRNSNVSPKILSIEDIDDGDVKKVRELYSDDYDLYESLVRKLGHIKPRIKMNNIKNFVFQDEFWEKSYKLADEYNNGNTPVLCYDDLDLEGFQTYKYWNDSDNPKVVLIHKDFLGCMHETFFKRITEYKCVFEYGCHQLYVLGQEDAVNNNIYTYTCRMYDNQKKIGFVHIPKTAGTSIWHMLANKYCGAMYIDSSQRVPLIQSIETYKCIAGHVHLNDFLSLGVDFDYLFTVFRDPKDRFLSSVGHSRRDPKIYNSLSRSMKSMADESLMDFSKSHYFQLEVYMQSHYMGWDGDDTSFVDKINKVGIDIFRVDALDFLARSLSGDQGGASHLGRKNVTENKYKLFSDEEVVFIESDEFNFMFDEENRRLNLIEF
jgi:hypothetical protein